MTTRRQPGLWRYAAGVLLIAGGVAAFVWGLIASLSGMTDAVAEFGAPGSGEARLEPGAYTVFFEFDRGGGFVRAEPGAAPDALRQLRLSVFGPGGTSPEVQRRSGHSRYAIGSRTGYDAFRFSAGQGGRYELRAAYPEGVQGPRVLLRVTDWTTGGGFRDMAVIAGGVILLVIPGALVIVLTHRARNPAAESAKVTRGALTQAAPYGEYLAWRLAPGRWGFSAWAAATLTLAAGAMLTGGVVRLVAIPFTSAVLFLGFAGMGWRMNRLRASVPAGAHIAGDVMYCRGLMRTPAAAWLEQDTLTVRPLIGAPFAARLDGAGVQETNRYGGKAMPQGGRFFAVTLPAGKRFALGVTDPAAWRPYMTSGED